MLVAPAALAQVPIGNVCQTNFGACQAFPQPAGAPCVCMGPGYQVPGVIVAPGGFGFGFGGQQAMSPFCGTMRGVCQLPGPAPVGARCNCFGVPGQVIPP